MSNTFFEPMSHEEWEQYKEKAREYDEREFAYAHGALPLTGEDLRAMIAAENARIIQQSLQEILQHDQEKQKLSSSLNPTPSPKP